MLKWQRLQLITALRLGAAESIGQRQREKLSARSDIYAQAFFLRLEQISQRFLPHGLNELVELWMARVDQKVIRDFGQTRMARFEDEKSNLRTLPDQHFEFRVPEALFVNREGKITYQTNSYSMPSEYRGKQLEGLLDLINRKLTLKYSGTEIRTLDLEADGAKKTLINPDDKREHYNAWLEGRDLEERVRKQVFEKRKKAETETTTADPAIYDSLFIGCEQILEVV